MTGGGTSDSPGGGSISSSSDLLQKYILPLLTTVSLMLRMPASALTYLNEMYKPTGGGGPSSTVILQRAQALVLSKAHKAFKKDIKAGDMGPGDSLTFEFLRANLEYLKVRRN